MRTIDVEHLLSELGGVARQAALLRVLSRADLRGAVRAGLVVRDSRGLYVLPGVADDRRVAARLGGVLSHESAALARGWGVKQVPDRPHVIVRRGRRAGPHSRDAHVHYRDLAPSEVEDGCTSVEVTLRDCLRTLPLAAGLAVADSALRVEGCHQLLQHVADTCRGPGSPQVRRVATLASDRKANPFESALHAVAAEVPGLAVKPQLTIRTGSMRVRPDLVDQRLRLVLEADSFEWHGGREAPASDARRYNALVVDGWLVLRFSYEEVMSHPARVLRTLLDAVALAERLAQVPDWWARAA